MSIFIWPDSDDIKHILKIAKILSFSPHFNRLNSVNLILHFFADLFCFKFKIQKLKKLSQPGVMKAEGGDEEEDEEEERERLF